MSKQLQVPYKSIPDMFLQRVAATPAANAFAYPGPNGPVWLSWKTVGERATAIAAGLHAIGVQPQDGVAIASNTRVEWVLADLGIMCAGAATTTIYPTTEAKDAAFILSDSGVKVLIAEDAGQVAKTADASLPNLTHVVVMDGTAGAARRRCPVLTLAELEEKGRGAARHRPRTGRRGSRPGYGRTTSRRSCTPPAPPARPRASSCCTPAGCGRAWRRASSASCSPTTCEYLWLPLSHSFGKTHPLRRHRRRPADLRGRSHRQDRGEPAQDQADHHVRRAAHLREALQRRQRRGADGRRRQVQDLQVGLQGRQAGVRAGAAGQEARRACSRRS